MFERAAFDGAEAAAFDVSVPFTLGRFQLIAVDRRAVNDERGEVDPRDALGALGLNGCQFLVFRRDPAPPAAAGESLAQILTRRELQVAVLIADGECDKAIARKLAISVFTVREHIRRIFAKLHVSKRSAIIAKVLSRLS